MQIVYLALLILTTSLFSFDGGLIDQKIIQKAERKYGGPVVSRLVAYNEMIAQCQHLDVYGKLEKVNDFFNAIPYKSDNENWKREDYWATPLELLSRYHGDGEDYAIAKYFALTALGVESKKLYFSYVNIETLERPHMVLTYHDNGGVNPLVLDKIEPKMKRASQRNDLTPIYNFNIDTIQSLSGAHKNTHKEWEKLYKRVQRNKL